MLQKFQKFVFLKFKKKFLDKKFSSSQLILESKSFKVKLWNQLIKFETVITSKSGLMYVSNPD